MNSLVIVTFVIVGMWLIWLTNNAMILKNKKNKKCKCSCSDNGQDNAWRTKEDKIGSK